MKLERSRVIAIRGKWVGALHLVLGFEPPPRALLPRFNATYIPLPASLNYGAKGHAI